MARSVGYLIRNRIQLNNIDEKLESDNTKDYLNLSTPKCVDNKNINIFVADMLYYLLS